MARAGRVEETGDARSWRASRGADGTGQTQKSGVTAGDLVALAAVGEDEKEQTSTAENPKPDRPAWETTAAVQQPERRDPGGSHRHPGG